MGFGSVPQAMRIVFSDNRYKIAAVALSFALFLVYISIPIALVPGNTIAFFFSITPPYQLMASGIISIVMGVVLAMQIFSFRNRIPITRHAGAGLAGFLSGSISVVFTTATCASCV